MDYTSAIEVAGFAAISAGVSLIYLPAGVIAAGLLLVLLGYLLGTPGARNSHSETDE